MANPITISETNIEIAVTDSAEKCDGCGCEIKKGEPYITGISSCCGQCYRLICPVCVAVTAQLIAAYNSEI